MKNTPSPDEEITEDNPVCSNAAYYTSEKREVIKLTHYDPNKRNLPRRRDYVGAVSWLKEVKECLGDTAVFALDEALMCQGLFLGRTEEYLVWVYGEDTLADYNGVVVLGNLINRSDVVLKNGLKYTNLDRTVNDALEHQDVLDMQGITEAVSRYYYSHNESFEGIAVDPKYREAFESLCAEAVDYYTDF